MLRRPLPSSRQIHLTFLETAAALGALLLVGAVACKRADDAPAEPASAPAEAVAPPAALPTDPSNSAVPAALQAAPGMAPADPAAAGSLPPGHPPVGGGNAHPAVPAADSVAIGTVAPADLAIADLRAQRQAKAGQSVAVRGRVWKVSRGILGRNWLHLRDKDGGEDLVVTSEQDAQPGQLVLARGKVAVDRDLGMGYQYDVLVEDAALTVEP